MITERKYRNALAVVKRYQDEQAQIKLSKMNCANIDLDANIRDLYYSEVITTRLYNVMRNYFDYDVTLREFKDLNIDDFMRLHNVGKRTINEFIKLMEYGKGI
jgi:hypothetical protein